MGLRGPAPTPIEIKRAQGNPGRRPLNEAAPKPTPVVDPAQLHCPDYLDEFAREEWDRIVPMLIEMGTLTTDNYLVVAMIANVAGRLRRAQLEVNSAPIIQGPSGPTLNPYQKVVESSEAQLKPLLREVGITPSSRQGVSVIGKREDGNTKESPLKAFLAKRQA